jgi:hypothetical protein
MSQNILQLTGRLQQLDGRLQRWQDTQSPLGKVGWVLTGYVLAVLIAAAVLTCEYAAYYVLGVHISNGGMQAFGDFLLFVAVFTVASIPASLLALRFLAACTAFWSAFAGVALAIGFAGLAASVEVIVGQRSMLADYAFLLVLSSPFCALLFGVLGFFAPIRSCRQTLFAASATEVIAFTVWIMSCISRNH